MIFPSFSKANWTVSLWMWVQRRASLHKCVAQVASNHLWVSLMNFVALGIMFTESDWSIAPTKYYQIFSFNISEGSIEIIIIFEDVINNYRTSAKNDELSILLNTKRGL